MTHHKPILVCGAGSWGTALAIHLAQVYPVYLWTRRPAHCEQMRKTRVNQDYLPDVLLPEQLTPIDQWSDVIAECGIILTAIPSKSFAPFIEQLTPYLQPNQHNIINAAKGFCHDQQKRLSEIAQHYCPTIPFGVITGPSFAKETAKGLPTTVVLASTNHTLLTHGQQCFSHGNFRCYTSEDVIGAEIGGALKNVFAIATGICDGLGFGSNAKTGLITRGLIEITRFGQAFGAHRDTLYGLSGLGDLILTCTDDQSRNRRFGLAIGAGQTVEQAQQTVQQVVEGALSTQTVAALSQQHGIDMPITQATYQILFQSLSAQKALELLINRPLKSETTH